jgi:hypothetical protein
MSIGFNNDPGPNIEAPVTKHARRREFRTGLAAIVGAILVDVRAELSTFTHINRMGDGLEKLLLA